MGQKFTDAARAELAESIGPTNTTLYLVEGGDLFPVADTGTAPVGPDTDWFKVVIQDVNHYEIVYVRTHVAGANTFTNVLRGQEGTVARSFLPGATIGLRQTAADAQSLYEHMVSSSYVILNADATAKVSKRYWLQESLVLSLPDLTDVEIGDTIVVSKSIDAVPTVIPTGSANIITEKGPTTSILFDINAEITFVFNGTDWEL